MNVTAQKQLRAELVYKFTDAHVLNDSTMKPRLLRTITDAAGNDYLATDFGGDDLVVAPIAEGTLRVSFPATPRATEAWLSSVGDLIQNELSGITLDSAYFWHPVQP